MSSILETGKYNTYRLKGTNCYYEFDYDTCQQVKKDLPYKAISLKLADEWYEGLGYYRRKKVKVIPK